MKRHNDAAPQPERDSGAEPIPSESMPKPPEGVSVKAWMSVGATASGGNWIIPERNSAGEIIGRAIRRPDGTKDFEPRGNRGLILSYPLPGYAGSSDAEPILICEGASDTAAAITIGFDAVGVPMAGHSAQMVAELLAGRHLVIVGDGDQAGKAGAEKLANALLSSASSVRVIYPPDGTKDLRQWVIAGALKADICTAVGNATPWVSTTPDQGSDRSGSPTWEQPSPLFEAPKPCPFPLKDAFPPALADVREFVRGIAEELQVPEDLIALLLLAVASACIAKKVEVEARSGWREIAVIWVLVLLESGERKSVAFRRLTDPVTEWERDQATILGPQLAAMRESRNILEAELKEARRKAAKGDAGAREEAIELAKQLADFKEIVPPTIVTTDTTSEALVSLMINNQERALVASPEADALDVLMGRYDDKARPNMGVWLKGYSGDRVRVHRRGRDPEFLDKPSLSVALTVQPEAVRGMFASRVARGRGLLARFFTSVPSSKVGYRRTDAPPVEERLEAFYIDALRHLLDLSLDDPPRIVRLSPQAEVMFAAFEKKIEVELRADGCLGERRDWGAKICGGVLRVALVLHCLEVFGGPSARFAGSAHEVSTETMTAALSWAPYLIEHEMLVTTVVGCDPDTAIAHRILRWAASAGDAFSRRDCFNACRGRSIRHVTDLDSALRLLQDLGYIREIPQPQGKVGRPTVRYQVNPLWKREVE